MKVIGVTDERCAMSKLANGSGQRPRIGSVAYLALWLIVVGGKAALMYGVWRLAKAQGRSPWPPFVASIFCASIVFLALLIKGRAEHLTSPQNSN
jgi:hypothetical protein